MNEEQKQVDKALKALKLVIHKIEDETLQFIAVKAWCIILECSPLRNNNPSYIAEKTNKILEEIGYK